MGGTSDVEGGLFFGFKDEIAGSLETGLKVN
jgi:hypothetical protein